MDRQIVYPGSIPLDTDLLQVQRQMMVAIGVLARTVLGTGLVADGLACTPVGGGGIGVVIGPGSLTALSQVDVAAYGSLAADASPLVKTGVNPDAVVLPFYGPPDAAHAICWLVQAQLSEFDTGPIALPYYNAASPGVAWSGPGNSGAAQNTRRVVRVALSVKAGQLRDIGDRFPPPPDPGWAPLFSVMSYFGRETGGVDIAPYPGGPFVPWRLPQLAPGFSRLEVFAQNTVWRVPLDVRRAKVRLVGAGGGGGGAESDYGGGGGGAGGYAEAILAVQPDYTFEVTVGVGGVGGSPRVNGQPGGTTSFGGMVSASGGQGGRSANPDSSGGAGGQGLLGTLQTLGGQGGTGPLVGSSPGGGGGAGALGGGGCSVLNGGLAANGQAPGSGAAGAYGTRVLGGTGANGLVLVEY